MGEYQKLFVEGDAKIGSENDPPVPVMLESDLSLRKIYFSVPSHLGWQFHL